MRKLAVVLVIVALFCVGAVANTRFIVTEHEAALEDGEVWQFSYFVDDLGSIGATNVYLFDTPATEEYHFTWEIYSTGGIYMYIYENPTISDTQTESTMYCKNRIKDTASPIGMWIEGNFTLDSAGSTVIKEVAVGSGNRAGGVGSSDVGWVLAQSEQYYIIFTALTANPAYSITLQWHRD